MTNPEVEKLQKVLEKFARSIEAADELASVYKEQADAGEENGKIYYARYKGQSDCLKQCLNEISAFQSFCKTGAWGNK